MSRSMAPVEPDPAKITACSSLPPTARSDDRPGILAKPRCLQTRSRRLGMGVGVKRQNGVADEFLDEVERSSRGGVVGVGDPAQPEGSQHGRIAPDDRSPDGVDQEWSVVRMSVTFRIHENAYREATRRFTHHA